MTEPHVAILLTQVHFGQIRYLIMLVARNTPTFVNSAFSVMGNYCELTNIGERVGRNFQINYFLRAESCRSSQFKPVCSDPTFFFPLVKPIYDYVESLAPNATNFYLI